MRLAGADASMAEAAVEEARLRFGLAAAGEPMLFTWRPSAAQAMADQAVSLGKLVAFVIALFGGLVGLHLYFSRRPARA